MKRFALILALFPLSLGATVTTTTLSVTYSCNGSGGPFSFNFPISDPTALTVTINAVVQSPTVYTTASVNNNYNNGGSVLLNDVCVFGQTLVIMRTTPLTQTTVFRNNMPLPMTSFEAGLDKSTEIQQEMENAISATNTLIGNAACPVGQVLQSINPLVCTTGGGGGGGGAANPAPPAFAVNFANSSVTGFQGDANITINPTSHTLTSPNLSATSTISNLVTGSVNTQINVMAPPYNAKGDCSTDDHDAITLALRAADTYATFGTGPASVWFPKPPGGCYLTSPLTWYGESLIGQPAGFGDLTALRWPVLIRSKPGLDIVQAVDPLTSASIYPHWSSWTIKDITFQPDASVAGNYPHRWPGKWFDDTHTTSGSAVISTINGQLSEGDVGQAIQIAGAGSSACNDGSGSNCLITTILSLTPAWAPAQSGTWQVVTLAANATANLTNAHTYLSLMGLPVTQHVGNCGIALPMTDALTSDWPHPTQAAGNVADVLENVTFAVTNSNGTPNACGMFSQGSTTPYQIHAKGVNFVGTSTFFGVVQGSAELNSNQAPSGNDYQVWDHMWFFGTHYPWISYNGGFNQFENWQIAASSGPQFLQLGNVNADCNCNSRFAIPEFELIGTPTGYGMRVTGQNHHFAFTALGGPSMPGILDASQSDGTIGGNFTANGQQNRVRVSSTSISLTDNGRGNAFPQDFNPTGVFNGMQSPYSQAGSPYKGESQIAKRITANYLRDGNTVPYNWDDLLIWPQDWVGLPSVGAYSTLYTADGNSPSGAELIVSNSVNFSEFGQYLLSVGSDPHPYFLTIGTKIPAGKVIVTYQAKCLVGTGNYTLNITATIPSVSTSVVGSDTEACSTTLATYRFTIDVTSNSNQLLGFTSNTSTNIYLAWLSFIPYQTINGLPTAGAGSGLTTGPTTSTLHDCPWFADTAGSIGDSGNPCANGATFQVNGTPLTSASTVNFQAGTNITLTNPSAGNILVTSSATAATAWSSITTGTNTAALLMGTGGSLSISGTGTINANQVNGATVPASKTIVGTNGSNQIIDASSATLANNTSGTAANLSGTPALPNGVTATTQSAGDNTTKLATTAFVQANATHTICNGTLALSTGAIAPGSKVQNTATCTGAAVGDNVLVDWQGSDPDGLTGYDVSIGYVLNLNKKVSATNTVDVEQMNFLNNPASITPSAVTVAFRVVR